MKLWKYFFFRQNFKTIPLCQRSAPSCIQIEAFIVHSFNCLFLSEKTKIVKWARECFFPSVSNLLRNLLRIVLFVCVFVCLFVCLFVCFLFCLWMCSCFCASNQMMIFIFIWAHPTFSCSLFYGHSFSFSFSYSFFSFFFV